MPDNITESQQAQKLKLMPLVASVFAEKGYRRATTAELSSRCGVKQAILYRLWADKKQMFTSSLDYIADNLLETWKTQLDSATSGKSALEALIEYESEHFADLNNYLIIFSGLNESDDPDIKQALQRMYHRIHSVLVGYITSFQAVTGQNSNMDPSTLAWAFMGIGTMATITKHLGILTEGQRQRLLAQSSRELLANNS